MIRAKPLETGAERERGAHLLFGAVVVTGAPGEDQHARGKQHGEGLDVLRSASLQRLDRLDDFVARCRPPDRAARPSGVRSASVRTPLRSAMPTSHVARWRASSVVFMNAPRPTLTSSTSAPMPSAIFLLRIDAQISGMLSTVPVTSRKAYSRRSAGAISSVWPMRTHPVWRRTRAHLVERSAACEIRESTRACRASRPCGRGRARTSSGRSRRTRPRAARSRATACRRRRRSSVCRPASRRTRRGRSSSPEWTIASVSDGRLVQRHAAQDDRHEQRGDLVVRPRSDR